MENGTCHNTRIRAAGCISFGERTSAPACSRLNPPPRFSAYLAKYAAAKGIYHRINFVNADHVHVLVDLPTSMTIEQTVKLLKGASSHWINERDVVPGKFSWGRGYAALSVSQSGVADVSRYIANQAEHHRVKSFLEEYRTFVERYGLQWREELEETVETVSDIAARAIPAMNRGANESGPSAAPANKLRREP